MIRKSHFCCSYIALLAVALLFFSAPVAGETAECYKEELVLVIDPGHGGYDPGAVREGVLEKNINLQISLKIKSLLEEKGIRVVLTRDGDYNLAIPGLHKREAHRYDLRKRLDIAEQSAGRIFVSVHVNSGLSRSSAGAEAFYYHKSEKGKSLAESIQSELRSVPDIKKRIAKTSNCYVLRNAAMPAVLVEVGYLSNPGERKKLLSSDYQELLSEKIGEGIMKYLGLEGVSTGPYSQAGNNKNIKEDKIG